VEPSPDPKLLAAIDEASRAGRTDPLRELSVALGLEQSLLQAWRMRDGGRVEEARRLFEILIEREPNDSRAHNGLGVALGDTGFRAEALRCFQCAVSLNPRDGPFWNNLGVAQLRVAAFEGAVRSFQNALDLGHDAAEVQSGYAIALSRSGRHLEALPRFERAVAMRPDDRTTKYLHSESVLASGDFERGWPLYEARRQLSRTEPRFGRPLWLGDFPIDGKTILVCHEQGMGDSLQFCRYVPLLARRAKVVLLTPPGLARLLSGLEGVSEIVVGEDALPDFDAWIPMLSLPLAFGTTASTIPAAVPYLHADAAQSGAWRDYVDSLPGRKIGLAWAGTAYRVPASGDDVDKRRSMPLLEFGPLAAVPGLCLVSLQKGAPSAQARTQPEGLELHDWTEDLEDFADTAALVEALDLVISVDTSVAHLAGALGKPVWILNRYDQCWRWLVGRTDSPWYPTARLFRQRSPGDWAGVIRDVVEALRAGE
jgi:Flp pilus assembly protein TadD